MIIPINNDFRINSDANQWILQQQTKNKDKETGKFIWRSLAYYTSLENILKHLYDRQLRLSNANTLVECMAEAKNLCIQLSQALKPIITVDLKVLGEVK
jgi:hypothetical protein